MSYDLTNTETTIHGRFWFPDDTDKIYEGHIRLVAGKDAIVVMQIFQVLFKCLRYNMNVK